MARRESLVFAEKPKGVAQTFIFDTSRFISDF